MGPIGPLRSQYDGNGPLGPFWIRIRKIGLDPGSISWIDPETATFGPRDPSEWLWGAILLRISGLGPQNDGLRLREGTFRPFGPWDQGPMARTLRPFGP